MLYKAVLFLCKLFSTIIAVALAFCALTFLGFSHLNASPLESHEFLWPFAEDPSAGNGVRFDGDGALVLEVRNGESAQSVGTRLKTAGIIQNRYFWNILFRIDNEYLKTGVYRIELPASQTRIRSILTAGEQILVRVTIPEGLTLRRTADLFEEAGVCQAGDFLAAASSREILNSYNIPGASIEGYLYPDTYIFSLAYPAQLVVRTMADTFFRRLEEIEKETSASIMNLGTDELFKKVIIASIIEREYQVQEEAPVMSGVFNNRLRIGMALQSCATVEYVITEILERPHQQVLYNRDLEINNPYNTYLHRGLPPGPISSPGKIALKAAFAPVSTNYLYFRLVDASSGRHYFSPTLDEHIKAGVLFVKGR